MVNTRADVCTPLNFINQAIDWATENNLTYKKFYDEELSKENLNLIYAVGKGSEHRPGFLVIEYSGEENSTKDSQVTAIIGKGVTFDAGGLNIKGTGFMESMFMDKGGACAALESFKAAVALKLKKNLVVAIPLAENSCSHSAYRPSDIIKSHKGLTVEITNTDAEGRLILADAMSYVQKNYKVDTMVEMSTLTGACMVGLGKRYGGLFCNDEETAGKLLKSGVNYGEDFWRLPLNDIMKEGLKGGVSDLVNSNGAKYGGAIFAAEFLSYFVEEGVKWAHLDIAGPAMDDDLKYHKANQQLASGVGVATVVNFLKQ